MDSLDNLEKQFAILRDQLYQEKMNQVEIQLAELKSKIDYDNNYDDERFHTAFCLFPCPDNRCQEYLLPLQRLSDNMQSRNEVADILKKLRMENISHKYHSEEQAALQHFEVK